MLYCIYPSLVSVGVLGPKHNDTLVGLFGVQLSYSDVRGFGVSHCVFLICVEANEINSRCGTL